METLTSTIDRIIYANSDNGYIVAKSTHPKTQEDITLVGIIPNAAAGKCYEIRGDWENHYKFGMQFKIASYEEQIPTNIDAIRKYLSSSHFEGIGPIFAEKITRFFGKETLAILEHDPERVIEVPGIGEKKCQTIVDAYQTNRTLQKLILLLQRYGISTTFINKIQKAYGDKAIQIIQHNPYQLYRDIKGIGFATADNAALKMGIKEDSDQRIAAAIFYVLEKANDSGHCYLVFKQIDEGVNKLINLLVSDRTKSILRTLESHEELTVIRRNKNEDDHSYYLPHISYCERYVASHITALLRSQPQVDKTAINYFLETVSKNKNIKLSDEQIKAVIGLSTQSVGIMTGGPGVGKTTTLTCLVNLFDFLGISFHLAAPTGRAAQRMTEVTGYQASTIHRLLRINPNNQSEVSKIRCDALIIDESSMIDIFVMKVIMQSLALGKRLILIGDPDQLPSVGVGNVLNDLIKSKVIPVYALTKVFRQASESSIIKSAHMINQGFIPNLESAMNPNDVQTDALMYDSEEPNQDELSFIKRLLNIKNKVEIDGESVLIHDYLMKNVYEIQNNGMNDFMTKEIDDATKIIKDKRYPNEVIIPKKFINSDIDSLLRSNNANEMLKQIIGNIHPYSTLHKGIRASDFVIHLYANVINTHYDAMETQVLCPMKKGTLGTNYLNEQIQQAVNPLKSNQNEIQVGNQVFRVGDRVMQTKNNYELSVFNGDIGKIVDLNKPLNCLHVIFNTNPSKIVTYRKTILHELTLSYACTIHKSQGSEYDCVIIPVHSQSYVMLQRNLIYTAITRAKKLAIFVGTRKAISIAVMRNDYIKRQTNLQQLLNAF